MNLRSALAHIEKGYILDLADGVEVHAFGGLPMAPYFYFQEFLREVKALLDKVDTMNSASSSELLIKSLRGEAERLANHGAPPDLAETLQLEKLRAASAMLEAAGLKVRLRLAERDLNHVTELLEEERTRLDEALKERDLARAEVGNLRAAIAQELKWDTH